MTRDIQLVPLSEETGDPGLQEIGNRCACCGTKIVERNGVLLWCDCPLAPWCEICEKCCWCCECEE